MLDKVKQWLSTEKAILSLTAFLSVLAVAPFGIVFSSNSSSFLFYIFAALVLFLTVWQIWQGSWQAKPVRSVLFLAPQVFLLAVILSTIFNPPWFYDLFAYLNNFDSLLFLLLIIFIYKLVSASFKGNFYDKLLILLQSVYIFNFLLISISLLGQLSGWWNFYAPISSPVEYSVFSSLVFILSLLQNPKYKKEYWLRLGSIFLSTVSLVFLNIYVAWLVLLFSSLLSLYFYFRSKFDLKTVLLVVTFVISGTFLLFGSNIAYFTQKYTGISVYQDPQPSSIASLLILQNAYNSSLKYKAFGTGPASFSFDWFRFKSNDALSTGVYWNSTFEKSANSILHFFITFGILGGTAWLILLLAIFSYVFKFTFASNYKRIANTTIVNSYIAVFVLALAFVFYTPGIFALTLFFVFLANFVVALKEKSLLKSFKPDTRFSLKEKICPWILIIVASLALYAALSIIMSVTFVYLKSSAKGDVSRYETYAKVASYILPTRAFVYDDLASVAAYKLRQSVLDDTNNKDKTKNKKGNKINQVAYADEMVRYLQKAAEAEPYNFRRWLSLASAQALKYSVSKSESDYKAALNSVSRASALAPNHPFVYFTLSYVASVKKDLKTMKQALLMAINLKPDFKDAYTALYDVALASNDTQEAVSVAQLEVQNNPNDLLAWKRLAFAFLNNKQYKEAELTVKEILNKYPLNAKIDMDLLQILVISLSEQGKKTEAEEILKQLSKKYKDSGIDKLLNALQAGEGASQDNQNNPENQKDSENKEN